MDEAAKSEMAKLETEVNACGKTLLEFDADAEKLRLKRIDIVAKRDKALKRMRDLNAGLVPSFAPTPKPAVAASKPPAASKPAASAAWPFKR